MPKLSLAMLRTRREGVSKCVEGFSDVDTAISKNYKVEQMGRVHERAAHCVEPISP